MVFTCHNDPEKSSTKINKHAPFGYSLLHAIRLIKRIEGLFYLFMRALAILTRKDLFNASRFNIILLISYNDTKRNL